MPLCFAYYCSGHGEYQQFLLLDRANSCAGYGHATRVSAFASHLLNLPAAERPIVYITSSAPKHVFADSIALGALYRYAEIDPVIVQPLASVHNRSLRNMSAANTLNDRYRVDRQKSVEVLRSFLSRKDAILETERRWLEEIGAHGVLSDAAFLGCYLSTPLLQVDLEASSQPNYLTPQDNFTVLVPDIPVPSAEIDPFVAQIHEGYRCADLLLLLPGYIPIPSFSIYPALPAPNWVDPSSNSFHADIVESLSRTPSPYALYPSIPLHSSLQSPSTNPPRSVILAPLLVRPPTTTPSPYSHEGRARLLSSIGVPPELHDPAQTKILIVSFGGQVFRAPSRSPSRSHSRSNTPSPSPTVPSSPHSEVPPSPTISIPPRLATPSHIWIPGAPPTSRPPASAAPPTSAFDVPELATIPPSPNALQTSFSITSSCFDEDNGPFDVRLLPNESWIAIVCGASKEKWSEDDKAAGLPDGFYVAPRDVYMPDLTAVGDVLLGKLIYSSGVPGWLISISTVSRPLFIEEHGLRLLLDREGVGVELSRQSYEAGDWALAVEEAWTRGKGAKERKRVEASTGIGMDDKRKEGIDMARKVVSWTQDWWMSLEL
ncbi:hypothetical protein C0995_010712 [Termitomyces sp. Mi166|nr:hypothetical protein C0995_010712 [Termitomyces sp. Mi166\